MNSRIPSTALDALADADNEDLLRADQPAAGRALPIDHMKHKSFTRDRRRAFQAIWMISFGTSGRCCFIHCPTFGVVR